ncbi:hypothetical protein OH77DRAFT_619797 [Trametes cingulata]|nr:hypothetical protein OH77DRAFT_619797 [Trametes cingulata]
MDACVGGPERMRTYLSEASVGGVACGIHPRNWRMLVPPALWLHVLSVASVAVSGKARSHGMSEPKSGGICSLHNTGLGGNCTPEGIQDQSGGLSPTGRARRCSRHCMEFNACFGSVCDRVALSAPRKGDHRILFHPVLSLHCSKSQPSTLC